MNLLHSCISEQNGELAPERGGSGFSLVEVTLALGVVSFALLAILGILPTGLSSLRQSMNQVVEAHILLAISGQAVVSDFAALAVSGLNFNENGQACRAADAHYTVNITKVPPDFPGSSHAVALTTSLTALRVEIVHKPPGVSTPQSTNSYTIMVANSGK